MSNLAEYIAVSALIGAEIQLPGIKLPATERLILRLLLSSGRAEMYGLQLVQQSLGALPRGTIYVVLNRMQQKGLVESRQDVRRPNESGITRRLYRPTRHGTSAYLRLLEASLACRW